MNIGYLIFGIFLTATLAIGIYYGRNVRTLKAYALGPDSFSSLLLTATIVATWAGGDVMTMYAGGIFTSGLLLVLVAVATSLALFIIGELTLRMGEFQGSLSVAEVLGKLYGQPVRYLSAMAGIVACTLYTGLQFRAGQEILKVYFPGTENWPLYVVAATVTCYAVFGGLASVLATDLFQFILLLLFIPLLTVVIYTAITVKSNVNMYDVCVERLCSLNAVHSLGVLNASTIFLRVCFLGFLPHMFQRVLLNDSVIQTRKAFRWASLLWLGTIFSMLGIGLLLVADNADLKSIGDFWPFVFENYIHSDLLKGLVTGGVIMMLMSTADSYLNTASVLFVNDILKPIGVNHNNFLIATRCIGLILGALATPVASFPKERLGIIFVASATYVPVVVVPLVLAILGFRTSARVALGSMLIGGFTALSLEYNALKFVQTTVVGMLANLITMLAVHYLIGEPGGWVGIKVKAPLVAERQANMRRWENVKAKLSRFNLYHYLTHQLPTYEGTYSLFGLYVVGPAFLANFFMKGILSQDHSLFYLASYATLACNALLLTYPIWPKGWQHQRFIAYFYPFALFYGLFVAPSMCWIVSSYHPLYLLLLTVNLFLTLLQLAAPLTGVMALLGPLTARLLLQWTAHGTLRLPVVAHGGAMVAYVGLLFGCYLIASLRNKATLNHITSQNHALAHHYNTITKAMHKLRTTPERFMQQLQDKTHGLDTAVAMSKALQEALKQLKDKKEAKPLNQAATQLTTHIQDSSGYLSKLLALVQNGGLLQRKNMTLRDFTHQLLNRIARNPQLTTELIIANQSTCESINWDIEKIRHLLLEGHKQLQSKHRTIEYFFLHIQDTKLTYPNYPDGLPAIAFTLTTGEAAPQLEAAYLPPDKVTKWSITPYQAHAQRCIDAHYGYFNPNDAPYRYLFVLPTSLKKIRPESITNTPVKAFSPAMLRKAKGMEAEFWTTVSKKAYDIPTLEKAVAFMKEVHAHQQRKSGEPYYTHPLTVAQYASQHSDSQDVLIAALLHDTIEDTDVTPEALKLNFGQRVSTLVQHLSHIQSASKKYKLSDTQTHTKLEKASGDKEAVLIKLCDRLHNMHTLGAMPKAKRLPKAQETLNVYIPMAKKVGYINLAKELTRLCKQVA